MKVQNEESEEAQKKDENSEMGVRGEGTV